MKESKIIIESLLTQATEEAEKWLRNHLQMMMDNNPRKIDEILNRMGVTAFYKKGEPLWGHEEKELKGYDELVSFMSDFDSTLHLTGIDMAFKRTTAA